MKALLHFTSSIGPPVGVWWPDEAGGPVRSHYAEGEGAAAIVGAQVISQRDPAAKVEDYFDFLAEGMPFVNGWEVVELFEAPETYLARTRKKRQKAS